MMPAASVSALVFAHPDSEYFAVGQVGKDQVSQVRPLPSPRKIILCGIAGAPYGASRVVKAACPGW